ncbi:putative GTPase [Mycolicibacterium canariasense]|uniref:Putative GTPase n=1 Tax=Mycolicibacterium canariasense TaxID=228230 RepID=A0A100WCH3_MYCCR|nr:putative GTPase [Mycolicibacterium canariasense]
MGIPIVTSLQFSAALAVIASAAIIAGVVLLAGAAWGLIAAGVLGLVGAFLFYEPAGKR